MGLNMAGQVHQHSQADAARKGRNRAKLRNFEEQNRQYKREVMLDNAEWKNDVQAQDIEQDQLYQSMVNQWVEQDQQLDQLFAKGDQEIENAIIKMHENDYAGTGTGKTAARLAGKSAKKLGQFKAQKLHEMMMAKDMTQLRKESIRDTTQQQSWKLYENIRFSPIHGHTPMAPTLEAAPSKAGLILGLAGAGLQGYKDYKEFKAPDIGKEGSDTSSGAPGGGGTDGGSIDSSPSAYEFGDYGAAYGGTPVKVSYSRTPGDKIDSAAAWGTTL